MTYQTTPSHDLETNTHRYLEELDELADALDTLAHIPPKPTTVWASDIAQLIASLTAITTTVAQLADTASSYIAHHTDTATLRLDAEGDRHWPNTETAATQLTVDLDNARSRTSGVLAALEAAHRIAAMLGHHPAPDRDETSQPASPSIETGGHCFGPGRGHQ